MIRRSFRIGLKLGLFVGIAFALVKTLQSRRPPEDVPATGAASWPPLEPTPSREHAVATPKPDPEATAAAAVAGSEASERWASAERGWLEAEPAAVTPQAAEPATNRAIQAVKKTAKKAPAKKTAAKKQPVAVWVEPTAGVCPTSHPVKAKLASKIFHLPGMLNYERTAPDRCYSTSDAAEADGLRPAKR